MSAEYSYDYSIIRIVPRVERGEQINVGVILSCVDSDFLEARIEVDTERLQTLDSSVDLDALRDSLATIPVVCTGGPEPGPIGALPPRGRFRWLVSPRSAIIQMSPSTPGERGIHVPRLNAWPRPWCAAPDRAGEADRRAQSILRMLGRSEFASSPGRTAWPVRSSAASM